MTQASTTDVQSCDWTYQRQKDLWDILSCNSSIWSTEIMHDVPNSLNSYPQDWLEALKQFNQQELWQLDAKFLTLELENKLPEGQVQWLKKLRSLEQIPQIFLPKEETKPPAEIFLGMKTKKQYEVEKLGALASLSESQAAYPWVLDIGGGSGHLLRFLTYKRLGNKYFCLDGSAENLNHGLAKWKRIKHKLNKSTFPWLERIHYQPIEHMLKIDLHKIDSECLSFLPKEVVEEDQGLVIGLHTCGDLALSQMLLASKLKQTRNINMPCCYLKLDAQTQVNLAHFTRLHANLPWNTYALTLATRAHGRFTLENYLNKRQVKYFRYGIHLVLMEFFGRSDIHQVHEAPLSQYFGKFSQYATSKLFQLGLIPPPEEQLELFFHSDKTQSLIEKMFFANLYRWQFGRSLELSLLLDRVHWIREQNIDCQIGELFDEAISPRNVVLSW